MTQAQFGRLVGISQPKVSEYVRLGVLAKGASGRAWLLAYVDKLRDEAAGRGSQLARERARHERLKADHLAMRNDQKRRELVPRAVLDLVLSRSGEALCGILSKLPDAARQRMPNLGADAQRILTEGVAGAMAIAEELRFPRVTVEQYLSRRRH